MAEEPDAPDRFEPLHRAHAIEQVVFAVQVDREISESGLRAADQAARSFAADLPKRSEIRGMMLTIGPAVGPAMPAPVNGAVFQRIRPDGTVESELRVERSSIVFHTIFYTRWPKIWGQARKYFEALLPVYLNQAGISAIGLNYVDKFVWQGAADACRPATLLRPGSPYIAPHVYQASDLWHSHTGAFIRSDDQTKRLLNVNLDYLEENGPDGQRKVVAIRMTLTDMLNQPGYDQVNFAPEMAIGFVDSHMNDMHDFNKEVLGNIVSDDVKRRIALEG